MKQVIFRFVCLTSIVSGCVCGIYGNTIDVAKADSVNNAVVFAKVLRESAIKLVESENGSIEKYIVERGDSWDFIARTHGVETSQIESLNPEVEFPYAGAEIIVPVFPVGSKGHERSIVMNNSLYETGYRNIQSENWDEAKKVYTKIIKESPSLTSHYMRGVANYNSGKYKEAKEDFAYVAGNDKYGLFDDISEKYDMADSAWEAKKQERENNWLNIASAVLQFGAEVTSVVLQAKQMDSPAANYNNPPTSFQFQGSPTLSSQFEQPGYYNNVFSQIMQKSIEDVNNQNQWEYNMVRQNYLKMGKDLSFDEFMSIKAQAYAETNGYSLDSNSAYHPGERRTAADRLNEYVGEKCMLCKGSKKCHACNGTKIASSFGHDYACTLCNDKGECPQCHGTGLAGWNR
jgi:LysM domain protein